MAHPSSTHELSPLYMQALKRAPLLSVEAEIDLLARWRDQGELRARDQLVEAHLRLVLKTATQFRGYGVSMADLVAEGNVGLVRALETFDPAKGLRFSTYAQWWVRAAMFEYVLKFTMPVSFGLSAERKRLFFKLRSLKSRISGPEGGALSDADTLRVAEELGARRESVTEMERLLSQPARSLDMPVGEDGTPWGEFLADDRPNPEEILGEHQELMYRRELLKDAWGSLSERERDIVAQRTLREQPLRLEDLAQRYGISRERVRQIEASALGKLRALVQDAQARLLPRYKTV